jgi:hypothetical protein
MVKHTCSNLNFKLREEIVALIDKIAERPEPCQKQLIDFLIAWAKQYKTEKE